MTIHFNNLVDSAEMTQALEAFIHATNHEPGGADAMTVDAAVGTGSLRTLGTGALQAAVGSHTHTYGYARHLGVDYAPTGQLTLANTTWTPVQVSSAYFQLPQFTAPATGMCMFFGNLIFYHDVPSVSNNLIGVGKGISGGSEPPNYTRFSNNPPGSTGAYYIAIPISTVFSVSASETITPSVWGYQTTSGTTGSYHWQIAGGAVTGIYIPS